MAHGGQDRAARHPDRRTSRRVRGTASSSSMLTIKGIYGREMFETWYAMIGAASAQASTSRP
ncbi:MAG: hypothetical protein V9F04_13815 [Dermatophilaceae bacterium]